MRPPPASSVRGRLLLAGLFFLQAHAIALWFVPFSSVLKQHGLEHLTAWAFASSGLAAFFSPMLTGVLADRHLSAAVLLRYISLGIALLLALTFWAIEHAWSPVAVLALIQVQQLFAAPSWGLTSMLVLAQLPDPGRSFGPLRVWGTYGWMLAGPLVSLVLHADGSTVTGFAASAAWIGVALYTFILPRVPPQAAQTPFSMRSLLGLETFALLRDGRHRAVFLGAGLLSIPLAAFYPYTPIQLRELGVQNVSAVMSLGQVSEALSMYVMARLLVRVRLKSLLLFAIGSAALRYALYAIGGIPSLLSGIFLHGVCFTLFFIPAQIYIENNVPREIRYRAQALMTLLVSGVGNLLGYLGCGGLRAVLTVENQTNWSVYWWTLAGAVFAVGIYFYSAYREPETPV